MKCLEGFRKENGYSKHDMAQLLDISLSLYEKVEYSDRQPSRNFMSRFKEKFPNFDMNLFFNEMIHDSCIKDGTIRR